MTQPAERPTDTAKRHVFQLRLTEAEHERLHRAGRSLGMSASEVVRVAIAGLERGLRRE